MAKWSSNETTWTPVAVADATNFTDAGYHALQGGSATQVIKILEVFIGGQASASSITELLLARDSTVGGTLSVGRTAALDPATAALGAPPVTFNTASTKPQRSSTLSLLNLSLNAFGGIIRWVAAPYEEIGMLGASASFGEISISSLSTGSPGAVGSHMIFEPQ
jgi:hypothetical protein